MKIRTSSGFIRLLGDEFSWRHKELLDFRLTTRASNLIAQKVMIRAGVPLAYAHWEGFIKNATELLLNFVSNQNLNNSDLSDTYFTHSVKTQTLKFIESRRVIAAKGAACHIRDASTMKAEIRHKNYVDTESNLSSEVFDQIALSVGIETVQYQYLYPYIDETILNNRNKIAHGENINLTLTDFHALTDRVVDLIRMYKIDLENIAVLRKYLKDPLTAN